MAANREPLAGKRLDSWKEIATFLGRAERTVKRWETERGLPVHRVPGGGRSAVFAYSNELAEWLKGRSAELEAEDSASGEVEDRSIEDQTTDFAQSAAQPTPVTPALVTTPLSPTVPPVRKEWPPSRLAAWLVPLLLAAGLITYFSIGHSTPHIKALAGPQPSTPGSDTLYLGPDSVAVLPFINVRGDANADYLSDGITESLIGNLAHVPQLKVRSRDSVFRYKGKDVEVRTVGNNLGVSAVVSGRVTLQGDAIEISTELTDVRDNTEIWGHRYTGKSSNLISLQQQIAGDIAGELRTKLSRSEQQQIVRQGTQNSEAYDLYLKGRYAWNNRTPADLEKAISYFNQAIDKDPAYAMAYSGLADSYSVLPNYLGNPAEAFPKSNAAARKALDLDPTLARPHAVLGLNEFEYDWDFAGAESEFKKAIELDPDDATAHQWYAEKLSELGRHQEALAEINRAHELDPLSPIITRVLGGTLVSARQYDQGIAVCKKLAQENPTFAIAHDCLVYAYWGKHQYPQVVEEWKLESQLLRNPDEVKFADALEQGFHSDGWKGASKRAAATMEARRSTGYAPPFEIARFYADIGDSEHAFQWLDIAYREHDRLLTGLNTSPGFDPIRSDPRFTELVAKVGLPKQQ